MLSCLVLTENVPHVAPFRVQLCCDKAVCLTPVQPPSCALSQRCPLNSCDSVNKLSCHSPPPNILEGTKATAIGLFNICILNVALCLCVSLFLTWVHACVCMRVYTHVCIHTHRNTRQMWRAGGGAHPLVESQGLILTWMGWSYSILWEILPKLEY